MMNNKEFFDRTIPVMLETNPCPDRDMIIKYVRERADNMKEQNKKSKIRFSKKYVIIPVIIAAVLALTGAVIHEVYRIGFKESDLITELKVGRYYLETVDGYAEDCYIEVFDDNKLQFFGIEKKDDFENGNYYDWSSAPVAYRLDSVMPFIILDDAWGNAYRDDRGGVGIAYKGDEYLEDNIWVYQYPEAKDYSREIDRETFDRYGCRTVHYVYEPMRINE